MKICNYGILPFYTTFQFNDKKEKAGKLFLEYNLFILVYIKKKEKETKKTR